MDELGASALRRTRLVTAASELARNALVHGGGGRMEMQIRKDGRGGGTGVVRKFRDDGTGIADVERALREGSTTRTGPALGLRGAKRTWAELEISSVIGERTTVTLTS